jgi:radical SAM protein with 4Fe4S-binding SPASM domain
VIDCVQPPQLGSAEYMSRFTWRTRKERLPLSGAFDLTYRCNLRCIHCYGGHLVSQAEQSVDELGTDVVCGLLSEAAEAGCLNVLFSGGEPLLRADFLDIYVHARRLGMLVSVFTNGTLVDDRAIRVMSEYPPAVVEISLYGSSAERYESITRVRGSWQRAMRGVHRLLDAGLNVALKSMILRDNADDVAAIEALAKGLGVSFRLDPIVTPRLDGDQSPLAQRVDPERAAAIEMADEGRRADAAKFQDSPWLAPQSDALFQCGAGANGFHIDPQGVLRPCIVTREYAADAVGVGFATAWTQVTRVIGSLERRRDSECAECGLRSVCGVCVGLSALEAGSPHERLEYLCGLGTSRKAIINSASEMGS